MKDKLNEILIEIGKLNGKVEGIEDKLIDHDEQFESINKKLDKHDEQFEGINKKLNKHDEQFENINKKFAGIDNKLSNMEQNQLKFDEYFKAIMYFHKERKVDINEMKVDVKDIQSELNILTIKSSRNSIDIERIKRVNEDRKGYEED